MGSLAYRHRDEVDGQSGKIGKSSLSGTKHKNDNKNNAEKGNFQNVQSIYLFFMAEDRMQ